MYEKDGNGREYRVIDKFIRAWSSQAPGWTICEVRQYANGSVVVCSITTNYVKENPDKAALHAIYVQAATGLGL